MLVQLNQYTMVYNQTTPDVQGCKTSGAMTPHYFSVNPLSECTYFLISPYVWYKYLTVVRQKYSIGALPTISKSSLIQLITVGCVTTLQQCSPGNISLEVNNSAENVFHGNRKSYCNRLHGGKKNHSLMIDRGRNAR